MNTEAAQPKTIVIAGDVAIDWNLVYYQGARDAASLPSASHLARACPQVGGAALLARLIETLVQDGGEGLPAQVVAPAVPENALQSVDPRFNHSYAIWEQMGDKDKKAWRVSQYLGIDPLTVVDDRTEVGGPEGAELILLDDANLGFRSQADRWPKALRASKTAPVLLKLSYPVARGELLETVTDCAAERTVAIVSANDLRLSNAQISRGLSWERIAQDTLWELSYNPDLSLLAKCAYVVVSYQTDGAALFSHSGRGLSCRLFFDPNTIENGWAAGYKGGMIGYTACLAAALAWQLHSRAEAGGPILDPAALASGIQAGLSAMRFLHSKGYQSGGAKPQEARIAFPFDAVAADIRKPSFTYAQTDILDPLGASAPDGGRASQASGGMFTILAQQCCDDLLTLARSIVREGPEKALASIPLGRFGKLLTVDRSEIESYRTVAALVQEYISQEKADKPVSIAVFGAPGSGKSFGIKEIANSLSDRIKEITFNLSQMNSPDDLIGALHQVRDEVLRGKIPLVFWDEFDTSLEGVPLGWLRYFLAPMQDGAFLEGQVTHPIGRAIFVFAGGTSDRMEEFGKRLAEDPQENDKLFRAVKGPDFKSRLKGFINILGPNPRRGVYDPYSIIRRAILLQSLLRRLTPQFFKPALQMDDALLDAFLEIGAYLHGVRSIESIISMSQLSGKTRFERSCLPPVAQLNLHVVGWEFMARVQRLKLAGEALETLARAVHEDYCEYMAEAGEPAQPFDRLPEDEREQNRQFALDIPRKLARAGYVMIHARTNEPPRVFPDGDLDALAEMEHVRWVRARLAQPGGWHYSETTDKSKHLHAGLLPWRKYAEAELAQVFSPAELAALGREPLPETEKEKDRRLVQRIPYILGRVGYTAIKLEAND